MSAVITIGILTSQGCALGTESTSNASAYRIPIGLQFIWGFIIFAGGYIITESRKSPTTLTPPPHSLNPSTKKVLTTPPLARWYVKKELNSQALTALAKIRNLPPTDPAITTEYEEIKSMHEYELSLGTPTYGELFRGTLAPRTWVGINVQMFQQLTVVNFIFYYGTAFFQSAGITKPYLITVATGVVNVFMTFPGIILVEKLGRRKFLLYGAAWMSLCQLIVGVMSITRGDEKSGQNVLAGFTCLFIAGFASTWGPGGWVLIGELFPLKHRARGMSLATASNWWWNWVIAFVVPYITDAAYGNLQTKIAFIWFATSLIGCVWTFFFVPETRYHSLETLDEMFESGVKPWNTAKWVPSGADRDYRPGDIGVVGHHVKGGKEVDHHDAEEEGEGSEKEKVSA
ncbi:general substrate transporter [Dendrothele bispora CBS 962.96]|uniref:General substrate transporter n=1 Tax=Dendrothele bispora (strain CBS 962.96) TaxID=1314807 RepID=A0A4S8L7V7_DENBC|nr:general substrate transporter [Dendrothele bispora CBS 962.96]